MQSDNRVKQYRWKAFCLFIVIFTISMVVGFPLKRTIAPVGAQDPKILQEPNIPVIPGGSAYRQTNLLSDVPGLAPVLDPLLVNPWGITVRGTSPFWIANNGTSTTQLVRGDVSGAPVVLNPGMPTVTIPGFLPTGAVGNATTDFLLTPCTVASCPAAFIFASKTGNISGWNPGAPTASSTTAIIAASHPGHVYTGLAIGNNSGGNRLYAADFANGTIDVFDGTFTLTTTTGGFADPTIPTTPGNTFHPFNIQNIGGSLFVTYAKVDPMTGEDEEGVGNGYVRKFNTDGQRDMTFGINNGQLNSPWGVAVAPGTFGIFGGALLIGNFGEGNPSIHAFNPSTGAFLGTLQNENADGIEIDELWGLQFGNGVTGDLNTLYFTAGTGEEEHGLFGKLNPTTATATSLVQFATDDFAISEGGGHIDITVTRAGDASGTATVNFNTSDDSEAGHASQKSDYEIALGTLTFLPGETSKTFRVLIVNDLFVEGDEVIDLFLSNPTGVGVGLGSPNKAELRIIDNDSIAPVSNPIDDPTFFTRQHYLDFQNREPDSPGLAFWVNSFIGCGPDTACIANKRVNLTTTFFQSPEFQRTGYLAYLTHRAAFGANASGSVAPILYGNFERDLQALQLGFVAGQPGAEAVLEANKVAYFNEFVTRPEFVSKYPSTLTNEQYVDNLLASAGLSPTQVRSFVVNLTNGQEVPPTVPTTTTGAARPASFGTARFQFNDTQTALNFSGTISNIDVTGLQTSDTNDNLIAAHIHAGASVAPGVNGPVVWGFFGAPFNDNNPNDSIFFPNAGVGGTFSGKWDAPEGNGTTLAAQLANLREGRAYINFHTRQFGGGEIRGNFPAADSFRNQLVAGLNGLTLTRAQVLRAVAESDELNTREQNTAFVAMGYFAYFRRDPDTSGFALALGRVNTLGDFQRANLLEMFLKSAEYRQRFGPDSTPFLNQSPTANNDAASTNALTPVLIDVLANDSDPDGDFLTISSVAPGTGGTPKIASNGRSIVFIPDPGFAGAASFQYTVSDNGFSCPGGGCSVTGVPSAAYTFNSLSASATVNITVNPSGTFQFSASTANVAEGAGKVTLTVTFTGGLTAPVSVDFATAPDAGVVNCATVSGQASERCDFNTTIGTLTFAPGETSKTFDVFIVDDAYVEGSETFRVSLSNPTGGPTFAFGPNTSETVTILDNDAAPGANPIDTPSFFVNQQYLDFLLRQAEPAGLAFYLNILAGCQPTDIECTKYTRGAIAANFFRSPEFHRKGLFVMYLYMVSLGQRPATVAELSDPTKIDRPHYREFLTDLQAISDPNDDLAVVSAKKDALTVAWLQRAEIQARFGGLTNAQFVQKLSDTAGVTVSNQSQLVTNLDTATMTRAQVLRAFAESPEVNAKFFKQAFVTMQYFGFLRRDPEVCVGSPNPSQCGYIFHNARFLLPADQAFLENTMVRGFIESPEYRSRFGTP